jgi:hypothetical protein
MSVSVEKQEEDYFVRTHFYGFNDLTTRESIACMLNARIPLYFAKQKHICLLSI